MLRNEFDTLMKRIESEYSNFEGDYDEWWEVLSSYSYEDIKEKLDHRKTNIPPIHTTLIRGLRKEYIDNGVLMKCDYCQKLERVYDTNEWLASHRKCSKIDFIDRQCKKIKGFGVNKQVYYDMNDSELERSYREVMNYYLKTSNGNSFIKQL